MRAVLVEDFDAARENYERLIQKARSERDQWTLTLLIQRLADIEALAGNVDLGHALHRKAISMCSNSLLPVLTYAKSLLNAFHCPDQAMACLNGAEDRMKSGNVGDRDEGLPADYYVREFEALRFAIKNAQLNDV